ncbi:MAG TPA: hypothetical protein VNT30_24735 [Stellaceae bacterium]|nr:hypothetical protein [Stellaceae bacterium]
MQAMIGPWTHIGPPLIAAFLASLVECVEALTIVLAVGAVRGWRLALGGAGAGALLLVVLVLLLGPSLRLVPIQVLQVVIGVLLLLFGTRWLRKAILRASGFIALRDETAQFAKQTDALQGDGGRDRVADAIAWTTAFKAVVLEGLEVIFIVIAVGAVGDLLVPAGIGAGLAVLAVVALGFIIHRPLARVPENSLKFVVGVMISSFGVFWLGEGLGLAWPGNDLALLGLIAGWLVLALAMVQILRSGAPATVGGRS